MNPAAAAARLIKHKDDDYCAEAAHEIPLPMEIAASAGGDHTYRLAARIGVVCLSVVVRSDPRSYFLGKRNDEKTAAFFAAYVHAALPMPKSGAYIAAIGIDTPYSSIVRHVRSTSDEYHAQEAEEEFLGKSGTFGVWVHIDFTPSFPDPSQFSSHGTNVIVMPAFWQDFKISLKQDQEVEPESVKGGPSYSDVGPLDQYGFSGAEVDFEYDPAKIDASTPATVDVVTPDGQDVQTTFDLTELR